MSRVKSYTDLEQSKKLAKILKVESADMLHCLDFDRDLLATVPKQYSGSFRHQPKLTIPCWSLAALLNILPKINGLKPILDLEENSIQYSGIDLYVTASNPVDACVNMIIKLHELKKL